MTEMTVSQAEITKLELQRGDVLLVRVPVEWTQEQCSRAHKGIEAALKRADIFGIPILLGANDVDFQILRKAENEK